MKSSEHEHPISIVVVCKSPLDKIMHAADLFDSTKALIKVYTLRGNLKPGETESSACSRTAEALLRSPEGLIACFVPGLPGGYRDETIQTVSNGRRWGLLRDFLVLHGYKEIEG